MGAMTRHSEAISDHASGRDGTAGIVKVVSLELQHSQNLFSQSTELSSFQFQSIWLGFDAKTKRSDV